MDGAVAVFLTDKQRMWQMKARQFAHEVLHPASLARDRIADPAATFDWDIITQGSRLGFRTAVVAEKWGGHGIDFVTQALVIAELARGDSAMAKTFSQCWKWSHLIAEFCTPDQQQRFLKPFMIDDRFLLGHAGTEPNAGSDHRLPPEDDPKSGWRLRAERHGDEWLLNGEKCFIANGGVAKLFFVSTRTDPNVGIREGGSEFLVPIDTPGLRVGKCFNKSGWRFYQNGVLLMNFSSDVIQRVTRLNMDIHAGAGTLEMPAAVDKLVRDASIWTHLAGDSVQRMKAIRRQKLK